MFLSGLTENKMKIIYQIEIEIPDEPEEGLDVAYGCESIKSNLSDILDYHEEEGYITNYEITTIH